MIKFKVINGNVYGDIAMKKGKLVMKKGVVLSKKAIEQVTSIYTQVIVAGDTEGVLQEESEMVDKTLAVYEVYGATTIEGRDYY